MAFQRMRNLNESAKALRELLSQRILVLDGAMGTMLQQRELSAADFGGAALEGCNENLVRTRPDVVLDIHRKYFEAGSDIVETNSFGGAPIVLAEYGLAAAIYSKSLTRGLQIARTMRTGMVHVNDTTINDQAIAPFGGMGASGNGGRFGSLANWEEFTQWQWCTARDHAPRFAF